MKCNVAHDLFDSTLMFVMYALLADLSLLVSTLQVYEWIYFVLLIASAVAVYLVLVARIGDELPRNTADKIFFVILGVVSFIWILSKFAPVIRAA